MKKFLVLYLGPESRMEEWKAMEPAVRKEREKAGMEAWSKWLRDNKRSLIDIGTPVGKTKRVNAEGIVDTRNDIGAYTIVEAETPEAAAELFKKHPHFSVFPGESIEVMECLPFPEM